MAISSAYISDAKASASGAINVAPAGTTLPTDASTALSSDFETFYSKPDGFTLKVGHSAKEWDAWEADDVVIVDESTSVEATINPIEVFGLNETVAGLMFGSGNVTVASGKITAINIEDGLPPECIVVVETVLRDGTKQRIIIPRFQLTSQGDIAFKAGEPNVPSLTGKCLPDSSGVKVAIKYATAS